MEVFENGGSASLCGRAKTEVFENDYVTGIGMSQLKKQNGCFLIRFRWCSVDGRKRYKNASVDEKLFIRFQETENGGFENALVWTGPKSHCHSFYTGEVMTKIIIILINNDFLKHKQANINVKSRRFGVIVTPFSRQSE